MRKNISYVCDVISTPSGDQMLKLLTSVYEGIQDKELLCKESGESVLEQAVNFGLLNFYKQGQVILTSQGYLVANVAKEYIHWVNNNREMPQPCPPDDFIQGKDVLDIGCSFGRWLWRFQKSAKSVLGLEMQQEYIELGRALAKRESIDFPEIRQGSAEELSSHMANNSIDFVFARLVLNHVNIEKTLLQIANALRPNGIMWAQVESFSSPFRRFLQRNKERELRHKLFAAFSMVNSIVFITTSHQMSIRIQGRMHSHHKPVYPTLKAWKAAFSRVGLGDFQEIRSICGNYIFHARKL